MNEFRFATANLFCPIAHAATHKVTRDILLVGDVWATDLSPLELQNAETKRVAESSGSRRLELSKSSSQLSSLKCAQGPANLLKTKGYSSTVALSVLRHLVMQNQPRRGDGLYKVPDSRRKQRLFEHGRTKHASTGFKKSFSVQMNTRPNLTLASKLLCAY